MPSTQVQFDTTGLVWTITDTCWGFKNQALLRWRLCPGEWELKGHSLTCHMATLRFFSNQPIKSLQLVSGWESRYYGAKTLIPVLELQFNEAPATIITSIQLSA